MGEEGLSVRTEVDLVVLLLAQGALGVRLELYPLVPQGELVGHIVLKLLHELPAAQGFQRGGLELGQVAVLLVGKVPAGGEDESSPKAEGEQAEQRGDENRIFFAHKHIPLSKKQTS